MIFCNIMTTHKQSAYTVIFLLLLVPLLTLPRPVLGQGSTSEAYYYSFTSLACSERGWQDGPLEAARFWTPEGIAYVCDMRNHSVRRIDLDGNVTTVAGIAGVAGSTDGETARATFNWPEDITIDSQENLFVADTYNFIIRKVSTDGRVTTFAGKAGQAGAIDGMGSAARFSMPLGTNTSF